MSEPEAQTRGSAFPVIGNETIDSEAAAGRWSNVIFEQMHAITESLTSTLEIMSTNACNAIRTLTSVIPTCVPLAEAVADTRTATINDVVQNEDNPLAQSYIPDFRG